MPFADRICHCKNVQITRALSRRVMLYKSPGILREAYTRAHVNVEIKSINLWILFRYLYTERTCSGVQT